MLQGLQEPFGLPSSQCREGSRRHTKVFIAQGTHGNLGASIPVTTCSLPSARKSSGRLETCLGNENHLAGLPGEELGQARPAVSISASLLTAWANWALTCTTNQHSKYHGSLPSPSNEPATLVSSGLHHERAGEDLSLAVSPTLAPCTLKTSTPTPLPNQSM